MKIPALYELTEQYEEVLNLLYDGETDEQTILDTLESIEGEIEDKADNYARIIKNLSAEAEMVKTEADRLNRRRKSLEDRADCIIQFFHFQERRQTAHDDYRKPW